MVRLATEMASKFAGTALLKDLNERTILETIRAGSPISRAEISRRAGISKPTVSLALQSLLEAGLVRETQHDGDGPTYGATFFEPVPEAALVFGLDFGARFLRAALCDLRGEVRARQDVEVNGAPASEMLDSVPELRDRLLIAAGMDSERIDGVVVGVPGVVEPSGRVMLAENISALDGMDVGPELGERLQLPVRVENDVNLAALGEHWRGIAQGVDDFAFLWIGTGLGSGLVLHGDLHRGHHGAAGEIDYAMEGGVERANDPCGPALSAFAARLAESKGHATVLAPPFEARAVFAAARGGDALAREVVAEEAQRIAAHAAVLAGVADVALVVLGGGIGANGDLLLDPVRGHLARRLPYPPQVEVSSLGEASVLTGALAVGLRAALDHVFENRRRGPELTHRPDFRVQETHNSGRLPATTSSGS